MKMTAAMLYAPKDIRIETRDVAPCGEHDVIINLKKASLCPTDIKKYNADKPDVEGALKQYGPYILGHEAAGIIVETGAKVTSVKVGDHVAVSPMLTCGTCYYCRQEKDNLCMHVLGVGGSAGSFGDCEKLYVEQGVGGCFATHLKVPEGCVMILPESISMEAGSLLEPLADVVHSVEHAQVSSKDDVVIFGLGPMGLFHVITAKYYGAKSITAIDIDDVRLNIAKKLGVDHLINSANTDPVAIIKSMTYGVGANKIFVTSGGRAQEPCTAQAMAMVAKEGTVALFASADVRADNLNVSINQIHYNMINLTGTVGFGRKHAEKALEMMASGSFDYALIRNKELPLSRIEEAIAIYSKGENLKIGLDLES